MNTKELALEIQEFLGGLKEVFENLKKTVMQTLTVIGKKAQDLSEDVVNDEAKFIDTIVELILLYVKIPAIFKPVAAWILKQIIKIAIRQLGPDWLENIRKNIRKIDIVDNKIFGLKDVTHA